MSTTIQYDEAFIDLRKDCQNTDCLYYEIDRCSNPVPQYSIEIHVVPGSMKLPNWKYACSGYIDSYTSTW
jgi:hypothetical protein